MLPSNRCACVDCQWVQLIRPIPIMSTETLVSCAETRQTGAAKTSAAIKTRFIMRQIRVPLYSVTNKSGRSVTADRGWKRPFDEPIPLSRGRHDSGNAAGAFRGLGNDPGRG